MKKITIALILLICLNFGSYASAEYYVQQGDTMAKIAQRYRMSLKDLLSLNLHLVNPDKIKVGDFIVIRSEDQKKRDLVDYARSLQSVTAYKYGGNDFPYLVDCSSWTQGVYKKFGVLLPRTSGEQAKTGMPVTFKQLQLGDLMFFSNRPDHKITHVGIYMGQNLWISNLETGKDVQILSSWGSWSQKYFMWGARFKL
jgi:cell wall-associated NlpC family hydrolase